MKQFIFPVFILVFSGILFAIIVPDLTKASAPKDVSHLIQGTVADLHTGEYLPGVKVFCERTATETYTDFNGRFSLKGFKEETVSLSFDYISYQSIRIDGIKATEEQLQVQLTQ